MQKRAAIWTAVSSKVQASDEKVSLELQKDVCLAKATDLGYEVVARLIVPGKSRSITLFEDACRTIEAYAQLRKLVESKAIDLLIFYTKSRLGRTKALCETIVGLCHDYDVAIYDVSAPPSSLDAKAQRNNAGDSLISSVTAWRSQNEVSDIAEKHKNGMRKRIQSGLLPGNIPFGYTAEWYERKKYRLVVNEPAVKAVKKAIDLYMAGSGFERIAIELNAMGSRSPGGMKKDQSERKLRPWTGSAVRSLFERVWVYAGYAEVNRKSEYRDRIREKSSLIPPIIDELTLQRLLAEMALRERSNPPKGNHLFSGIVVCTKCNVRMSVVKHGSERKLKSGAIYSLPVLRCAQGCKRQISFNLVEKAILEWIEWVDKKCYMSDIDVAETPDLSEIANTQKQLDAIPAALHRAYEGYIEGDVDKSAYNTQKSRLEERRRALQDRLHVLSIEAIRISQKDQVAQQYETVAAMGLDLMAIGREKPAVVNTWLREHVRVKFAEDRTLTVVLA